MCEPTLQIANGDPVSARSDAPPVIDLLRQRIVSGQRDDEYRVGLAVEGGGMRGIVSGAMLIALRDIGAHPAFDCFCGTSSGSINLSYYLTGAGWDALAVYYDFLAGPDFFSKQRILRRMAPLNMHYLFDEVMADGVPLDYQALVDLPRSLLNVTATDVDAVAPKITSAFSSPEDAYHRLLAGAWLPILAGGPYEYGGRRYLDSGVLYPDPVFAAIDARCTHALVLNTRPQASTSAHLGLQARSVAAVLNRWASGLGTEYLRRHAEWDRMRRFLGYGETTINGIRAFRLAAPATGHTVGRLTVDAGILLAGARSGYRAVLDAFGLPHDSIRFSLIDVGRNSGV